MRPTSESGATVVKPFTYIHILFERSIIYPFSDIFAAVAYPKFEFQ